MTPQKEEEDTELDDGLVVTALHLLEVVIELRGHIDVPILGQLSDWLKKVVVFALCGLHGNSSSRFFFQRCPARQHTADSPNLWAEGGETCSS